MSDVLGIRESVPLAPLTTLGVGGPARFYARIGSPGALAMAVAFARARGLPLLVLGGGSNMLVADEGYPGLVAHLALRGLEFWDAGDRTKIEAGAGEPWDALVGETVSHGLAGFECLSGIPGLVGATPIQNVGAYGQEVAETITSVRVYDLSTNEIRRFENAECRFGYRESRFKLEDRGRYVVLSVAYRLASNAPPAVRYPELERALAARGLAEPSLADVRAVVLAIRRAKSMVLDPADPNTQSAGSFFVNPVVAASVADAIDVESMPRYPAHGGVKLSAAWLIERAGFAKGYARGAAGLSTKHALAIVNRGGATASEIRDLAREIRDRVRERFGVELTPEPVFVGLEL
jgi:UDP-N-acetylmuramate dehydrogenase